jgi:integrase
MAVRERTWKNKGSISKKYVVDYRDRDLATGKVTRRWETFELKRDAIARDAEIKENIRKGTHIAPGASETIQEAAEKFLNRCETRSQADKLERSTFHGYKAELNHVLPIVGHIKLVHFTPAWVRTLEHKLHQTTSPVTRKPLSHVAVARCLRTLGQVFKDARERGLVTSNPCSDIVRDRLSAEEKRSGRDKGELLEIGVHIPSLQEIRRIIENATEARWKILLMTAAFTGMRASELRALRWINVDLKENKIKVRERADRYGVVSSPKSRTSRRTIPIPHYLAHALKEWKLQTPGELVFPAERAEILSLQIIIVCGLIPACRAAGVVTKDGSAKYTGLHTFRHFYASFCLGVEKDGGLGLPPKTVQTRLGHSTIAMTMDRYGHLLPEGDNSAMNAAVDKLFALKPVVVA